MIIYEHLKILMFPYFTFTTWNEKGVNDQDDEMAKLNLKKPSLKAFVFVQRDDIRLEKVFHNFNANLILAV